MDWKIGLDKYLTSPPNDGFGDFSEEVVGNCITDEFYNKNEDWINEYDGVCNKWLNKLFDKGISHKYSAIIIERAFNIYIKTHAPNS